MFSYQYIVEGWDNYDVTTPNQDSRTCQQQKHKSTGRRCRSPRPAITRVTNASVGQGGNLIKFKGDTDVYPTIIAMVDQEPHSIGHDGRRRNDDGVQPRARLGTLTPR